MRYSVKFDDEPVMVDVTLRTGGGYLVQVDGEPVSVDVLELGEALSIKVGDRVVDLAVEGAPPKLGLVANGHRFYADVESDRYRASALASGGSLGATDKLLKSPMPGRVLAVRVEKGQQVSRGAAVVVVEAMKMENELKAPADGVVKRVFVSSGDPVEASEPLVEFE